MDDAIQRPVIVYSVLHTVTSTDASYAAVVAGDRTLGVTVIDNDVAAVTMTPAAIAMLEGTYRHGDMHAHIRA